MRRINVKDWPILSASATGNSAGINVSDYRNCVLSLVGSASTASLKVFVMGGIGEASPDFTVNKGSRAAASAWDFIECVDLEDGAAIDGDDGISIASNTVRLLEVNINALDWLAVRVTSVAAGTVTVKGTFATNQ